MISAAKGREPDKKVENNTLLYSDFFDIIRAKEINMNTHDKTKLTIKKLFWGIMTLGLVGFSAARANKVHQDRNHDQEKNTTSADTLAIPGDTVVQELTNAERFELNRNKIKFALAFVENFYDFTYHCGKKWTKGYGSTYVFDAKGKTRAVEQGETCTMADADLNMDRCLTFGVLKDVNNCIKVPVDDNTMITACMFRYCVGGAGFKKSEFLRALNSGVTGAELAKYLTGFRKDGGIVKRCYFFAAILSGEMEFSDLLDLRANGCYSLYISDILECKTDGRVSKVSDIKLDADGYGIWKFDNLQANLEKAKKPRTEHITIEIKPTKKTKKVEAKLVRDIVPEYVWNDVRMTRKPKLITIKQATKLMRHKQSRAHAYIDASQKLNSRGHNRATAQTCRTQDI